jgi:nucleoid-associated protein YgaU
MTAPRRVGVETIEFTPNETGVIPWICWMGMLYRHFEVIADTETGPPRSHPRALLRHHLLHRGTACPEKTPHNTRNLQTAGDTFSKIANKLYGDARRWREIARANRFRDGPR